MAQNYRDYQAKLGPSWLQFRRALAQAHALGQGKDEVCAWCAAAVRARVIATADEQGLGYLGTERMFARLPDEYVEAWRMRVQGAWDFWRMGGTRAGMLYALTSAGYAPHLIEHNLPPPEGDANPAGFWSEFSIFLMPGDGGLFGAVRWGDPGIVWGQDELRWGTTITAAEEHRILALVCQMKPAHSRPRSIVYADRVHFWGDPDLVWGQEGLNWGYRGRELALPQGRICKPEPGLP